MHIFVIMSSQKPSVHVLLLHDCFDEMEPSEDECVESFRKFIQEKSPSSKRQIQFIGFTVITQTRKTI